MIFAQETMTGEIIVDNFAGGGGASTGIEIATGRAVAIAINHDPAAILMHKTNHPYTEHLQASVWDVDPKTVCRGRPVGLAWFSPDCKHFSKAKGAALVDRKIRGLAWITLRWAAEVRPRVIILENVEEFQTWGPVRKGKPVKKLAGTTFRRFISQLEALGYTVEFRELVAADFGAPTSRKRFYMIARCDGKPIVWPKPTHSKTGADGLPKWRCASEIIDWSLPCPSVFASKAEIMERYGLKAVRPLADNTMRRIIRGVDKFTIKSGSPFLVECNHSGAGHVADIKEPHKTITAKHTGGLCEPLLAPITVSNTGSSTGADASRPVHTVRTGGGGQMLVTPSLMCIGQTGGGNRIRSLSEPTPTTVSKQEACIVAPSLIQYHTEQTEYVRGSELSKPINTVDAANRYGLTCANLVEYYTGGRPLDVKEPMHTVTSHDREAVVAAHVVKFKGDNLGHGADEPMQTVTTSAGEFSVCKVHLAKMCGGDELGYWPEIRALLNEFCGYTLADDEVLLREISGTLYYIADIGLRMLSPRELYNAMGFPPDYIIDRDYEGNEYKKSAQVARCGNAVCPPVASALVRANLPEWCGVTITTMAQLMDCVAV
nr:MAG TPA: DNA cytosine methyltransferase [Siphoviridae sp. ctqcj14]DAT99015.1 MAG TPA: DNA cytosine methyltransferase [Caudoviricetes sp.]